MVSMSQIINVADLTDQDAVLRILLDMQNHGTSYSLIQNGVEVAKVVPVEERKGMVADDLTRKRWNALEKMEKLSEKITRLWNTNESAAEAVANNRR